jgi:hypothetical protein
MKVSIKRAKKIVSNFVQQQLAGKNPPPIFLWGPPGVGKSEGVREIAAEKGIDIIDIRLGQMEVVDARGIPYKWEPTKTENEDKSLAITKWAIPEFFPQDPKARKLIFFDELSTADPAIQVVAYQLLQERQCGAYKLPPNVYMCAAGNGVGQYAISHTISSALANRMVHLDIEPDPGTWCEWAVSHNIAPEVIGFIRFSPEMLFDLVEGECERGWPSPRSWENVSKVLSYGLDDEELFACVEGLVGEVAATQFYAFSEHSKELGDIRAMMLDQTKKMKVPTEQDILYAIATNLAYWLRRGGETVEESEKMLDGFFRIGLQLPPAFATVAMVDALSGKDGEHLAKRLTEHKRFPDWQKKFAVDKKKKGL